MSETWVPSLREYAAWYQINGRRLTPRQVLMHPGPVNRGVELSGEVVDSPQAVITAQVEAGVVVRMAVLYELLAGASAPPQRRPRAHRPPTRVGERSPRDGGHEPLVHGPQQRGRAAAARRPRARPARAASTRATTCACATARSPSSARPARCAQRRRRGAGRGRRAATCCRRSSTRTCTCARPARSTRRTSRRGTRAAAAGGYCAVIAMPNTDPVLDSAPLLRSLRDAAARDARVPVGFLPRDHARPAGRAADRDGRAARARARSASPTTAARSQSAGMLRKALQYQRLCGGVLALHEEDPSLSRGGAMHEGAVSAALGVAGIPTRQRVDDGRARRRAGRLRGRARALPAPQLRRLGPGGRRTPRRSGWRVSTEVSPAPPAADRGGRARARHAHEDEPAAGHRGRPPGADRGAARGHDRLRRHRPRAARARGEGGARSSRRRWARPAWRPRSPRCTPSSCCPACSTLGAARRADDRRRRAVRAADAARSRRASRPTSRSSTSTREWIAGEHGWESRSENCCFAGRALHGPRAADGRRRRRRLPRARASSVVGGVMGLLARERAALVVVDVQEGFRPYDVLRAASPQACAKLLRGGAHPRACRALVSEQYPKGLGHTAPEVGLRGRAARSRRPSSRPRARTASISAGASRRSSAGSRRTSACQPDRARPARARASRCTCPPTPSARATRSTTSAACERLERAGAVVSTVEAALFELLERAGTPEFKAVQKLIL